jgi:hypothetical protein
MHNGKAYKMADFDDTETRALIVYILMIVIIGCILAIGATSLRDRNPHLERPLLPATD